ncbi:MAG: hypothetical protein V2A74_01010 [bacterium]
MRELLISLLVLTLLGCGGSDDKSSYTVKTDEGTMKVSGDEKSMTITGTEDGKKVNMKMTTEGDTMKIETSEGTFTTGENKVPDGFPLPVPDGAKITYSAHMAPSDASKQEAFSIQYQIATSPEELAKTYEKAFKDKDMKVNRIEQKSDQNQMLALTGGSDKANASVNINKATGGDTTEVIVTWTTEEK